MDSAATERVVEEFLEASVRVRDEVLGQLPISCKSVRDLVVAVNRRQVSKEWRSPSGATYSKHGIGVCMTSSGGQVVDLDVNREGQDIFDVWRVAEFARSVNAGVDEAALAVALEGLAGRGLIARDSQTSGFFYMV